MILRLFFLIVVLSISTAQAQKKSKKNKAKEATSPELRLDKRYPVYVTGKAGKKMSPCPVDSLILSLQDSLKKEGFKVMDSVQLKAANQIVIKEIMQYSAKGMSKDAAMAQINSRILRQTLRVQQLSCLQERREYSIFIYTSPKGGMREGVSQTFSLPTDSPARIIDIVLALIHRE
ncbi:MAG TPA: hypothetical protein VL728_02795 [Cyclobacteriaceae bacterium]|jgi:hypothetical protein|nr:hypothetical protein [Cyclobacteriaceae bacterium]